MSIALRSQRQRQHLIFAERERVISVLTFLPACRPDKEEVRGMTIYLITKRFVKDENQNVVIGAEALHDGGQIIEHADLKIPVSVDGNNITVLVNRAVGELEHGWVCGFQDYMDLRVDAFGEVTGEDAPILQPKDRYPAVRFNGDREVVWIERHDTPPIVHGERGR